VYDFHKKELKNAETLSNSSAQSLSFLNNCLHFVVGYSNGSLVLFDSKTLKALKTIEKAHSSKNGEAVNSIVEIKNSNENSAPALPFFATGGADSLLKIFEHNLYLVAERSTISKEDAERINSEPILAKK